MQIGWQIKFKTISGKDGLVSIYTNSSVTSVIELQPAEVPFETREDNDEDILLPVRAQSGYIRVIDNGDLEGLMPTDNKERYIEYTEDGALKWRGYMQPDTFSEPWDSTPIEVEFPVVSPLGVLDSITIDTSSLGVVTFGALIKEAVDALGITYDIYIPQEFGNGAYNTPLLLEVSKYNFVRENNAKNKSTLTRYEGESYLSVLEEICKFLGWTAQERGDALFLVSKNVKRYQLVDYNILSQTALGNDPGNGNSLQLRAYNLKELELAGDSHAKSILQGKRKVSIVAAVNPVGEVVPDVSKDNFEYVGDTRFVYQTGTTVHAYEQTRLYNSNDVDTMLYAWTYNVSAQTWGPNFYIPGNTFNQVSAAFVEYDRFTKEDLEEKRNYNYKTAIRLNNLDATLGVIPTIQAASELPVLKVKSKRSANYTSGAFVLSGSAECVTDTANTSSEILAFTILVKYRVGSKYWNGVQWTTEESIFGVSIDVEGKKIATTKTLSMPYNGADGYVMPINESLSGEMELTVYALHGTIGFKLYLDNFKVQYYGDDNLGEKSEESENIYSRFGLGTFVEHKEISMKMATSNRNKAGYGIVSKGGIDINTLYNIKWGNIRPEMSLLNTAEMLYGRTCEKLEVELVKFDAKPIEEIYRDGKSYTMIAESVNWKDESAIYTLEEMP